MQCNDAGTWEGLCLNFLPIPVETLFSPPEKLEKPGTTALYKKCASRPDLTKQGLYV